MRHGKKVNHLGRTSSHREAMLSNMASSLIMHKRISTTVAKAKALKKYIEPLITKSKDDSTHSRREVFSHLQDKVAVTELFRDISQKVGDRPGGYTRILRTGFRVGDAAEMCIIELVDYNENYTQNKGNKRAKAKSTRRGRTKKKAETETVETVKDTVKEEVTVVEETPAVEEMPATVEAEIVEETSVLEEKIQSEEVVTEKAEEVVAEAVEAKPEEVVVEEIPTAVEEVAVVEEVTEQEVAEEVPVPEAEADTAEK